MVFSLFSNKVGAEEISRLAARLQTFRVPDELELGAFLAPDFPDAEEGTQLVDLLGPNSWILLMLLKTRTSWLQSGPESEDPGIRRPPPSSPR